MNSKFLVVVLGIIVFLAFAQKRGWVNLTNKNRPTMGNPLGVFDEIFSPAKHQATIELKELKELKVEIPNTDTNTIHIDLDKR